MAMIRQETIQSLIEARGWAMAHPDGRIKIDWARTIPGREYSKWLRKCLHRKINRNLDQSGRKFDQEYQGDMRRDRTIIEDALFRRIRRSGQNILSIPEFQTRYPEINNPPFEF